MSRWLLPAVAVLTCLVSAVPAEAQTSLEFKFPDGRQSRAKVKLDVQQTVTLNDQKRAISSEQELVVLTTNGTRDADGDLRQTLKIDSLKARLTMPGGVVLTFDSSAPPQGLPGTPYDTQLELIKIHAQASWFVTRDKQNQVGAVDGRDKMFVNLEPSQRDRIRKQFDADYLRDEANRQMQRIPSRPLSPGDTWELTDEMRLSEGQKLSLERRYAYQGNIERGGKMLHQVNSQVTQVTYSIDGDASTPLILVSSRLTPQTSEGVILFDPQWGDVVEDRESVKITGDLELKLGDHKLTGQLDLTMSVSTILQDP